MENQHQTPIQKKNVESSGMNPVQAKGATGAVSAPPALQLQAGEGFESASPLQMQAASEGPIQRLGIPSAPKGQSAGTCGLFSLTHSVAHLYQLDSGKTETVRDAMLKAAGTVDKTVTAEGEITSFAVAQAIIVEYNKLATDYKIKLTQKAVSSATDDKAKWRTALGLADHSDEKDHAATLAVDSSLYYPALTDAFQAVSKTATVDGTKCTVAGSNITFEGLNSAKASERGSGAHWITIVNVTDDHVVVLDSNLPAYKMYFKVDEAYKLSDSLKAATRGQYLDTVYGGAGKEEDWVGGMIGSGKTDWGTMLGTSDESTIKDTIKTRLEGTDRGTSVSLKGLALKVEKA